LAHDHPAVVGFKEAQHLPVVMGKQRYLVKMTDVTA